MYVLNLYFTFIYSTCIVIFPVFKIRWNFSVARHNVKLIPDPAALCHGSKPMSPLNFDVRVIVPDGLVCGISLTDPKNVIWQHKVSDVLLIIIVEIRFVQCFF